MPRSKVKLAFIERSTERKKRFEIRQKNLMKKMSELTTMCGVDGCVIVYGPDELEPPKIWPSAEGVDSVLQKLSYRPQMERVCNEMDQEIFLTQQLSKVTDALEKEMTETRKKEITRLMLDSAANIMFQTSAGNERDSLSMIDLNDLDYVVSETQREIEQRLEDIGKSPSP